MSRRRTGTRYVPITISLKPAMVDDIEAELGPKQSRSQWIADAIKKKLDGDDGIEGVDDWSTGYLLSKLSQRTDINGEQKGILSYWLSQWNK